MIIDSPERVTGVTLEDQQRSIQRQLDLVANVNAQLGFEHLPRLQVKKEVPPLEDNDVPISDLEELARIEIAVVQIMSDVIEKANERNKKKRKKQRLIFNNYKMYLTSDSTDYLDDPELKELFLGRIFFSIHPTKLSDLSCRKKFCTNMKKENSLLKEG